MEEHPKIYTLQQHSNARNEDSFFTRRFEDGNWCTGIFDGTSWQGQDYDAGYEVSQEVAARVLDFVWEELVKIGPARKEGEKRTRHDHLAPSHDARILKALQDALVRLDEHLYHFKVGEKRPGLHGGGSILLVYGTADTRTLYSVCVGDCEGSAYKKTINERREEKQQVAEDSSTPNPNNVVVEGAFVGGVEMRLSQWPHNVNVVREQQWLMQQWQLKSANCFDFDKRRAVAFLRDLQTTRFLGAWNHKLQCRQEVQVESSTRLCNAPSEKGEFFCPAHRAHRLLDAQRMSYWEAETRVLRGFDWVVLASDGLWETMTTGRAQELIRQLPHHERPKAPKHLIETALTQALFQAEHAAKQGNGNKTPVADEVNEQPTKRLALMDSHHRRLIHDDLTVTVIFN